MSPNRLVVNAHITSTSQPLSPHPEAGQEGRREEQGIGEEGVGRAGREEGSQGEREGRGGRRLVYKVSSYELVDANGHSRTHSPLPPPSPPSPPSPPLNLWSHKIYFSVHLIQNAG